MCLFLFSFSPHACPIYLFASSFTQPAMSGSAQGFSLLKGVLPATDAYLEVTLWVSVKCLEKKKKSLLYQMLYKQRQIE